MSCSPCWVHAPSAAAAATSLTVRLAQPLSACQLGFGSDLLQPLPPALHASSDQPREFDAFLRAVPPTAATFGDAAGNSVELPNLSQSS
jgi:hypothetical protein